MAIHHEENYRPDLNVTSDAYSATSKVNQQISSEWFIFEPVDIYDTETGQYLNLTPEDLANPSVIKKYSNDSRYAMLLGESKDNPSGFMNMSDYIEEANITFDDPAQAARDAHDYEAGGPTRFDSRDDAKYGHYDDPAQAARDAHDSETGGSRKSAITHIEGFGNIDESNNTNKNSRDWGLFANTKLEFNGHDATGVRHLDGSSTITYKNDAGNNVTLNYDNSRQHNLTEVIVEVGDKNYITPVNNGIAGETYEASSKQESYNVSSNRPI